MDLLVKNAGLRKQQGLWSVQVDGGKLQAIEKQTQSPVFPEATTVIDAEGRLLTESFTNAHLHLDKVWTLKMMDEKALTAYQGGDMGKAMTAIELAAGVKSQYSTDWIIPNVHRALELAAVHGNLHIRAFADIDSKAGLVGIQGVLAGRDAFRGLVDVQAVAFPQDGVLREPGTEELIREAMQLGADVVGGIPWIEFTDADALAHVQKMVAIAREFDKDVSMLVDDAGDAGLRTLEMLAVEAIKTGWQGRCLAQHARAMSLYPKPYFQKLAALLKMAGLGVVSDPQTGPLHARVKELLEEGVNVCLGQDDISDAYYPYGRCNMLEVAFLASHLLWMTSEAEMEQLYDMITINGAKAMNIKNFGLAVGNDANLVVLQQDNVVDALRHHAAPRYVISHGKLVAESKLESTLIR